MADLWTFKVAKNKFLSLNKSHSYLVKLTTEGRVLDTSYRSLRPWLPCIFIQNQLRKWKRILLLELPPLNQSIDPSALLSFLYVEKYTGRWADSCDGKRSTCVSGWPPDDSGTTPLTPEPRKERPHSREINGHQKNSMILTKYQNVQCQPVQRNWSSPLPLPCWGKTAVTLSKYMAIVLFLRSLVNHFQNC